MEEKKNKTSQKQIEWSRNNLKKRGIVTIACAITKKEKEKIVAHSKDKGYKSISAYLYDIIKSDMAKDGVLLDRDETDEI